MPLTQTPSISLRDLALLAFAATFGWWAHSANTPVAAQRTPDQRADRADRDRSTPPDNSLAFQYGGLGPEGELTLYNAANHTLYVYPSIARNSNSHINCLYSVHVDRAGSPIDRENCPIGSLFGR